MKSSTCRILTLLSSLYLLTLTILAVYALRNIQLYALPISTALSALTIALPPLSGVLLALSDLIPRYLTRTSHHIIALRSAHSQPARTRHIFAPTLLIPLTALILSTILGTLAATHIAPTSTLTCALQTQWASLFKSKSGAQIERIQDALQCCGFRTSRDMAFPFPDRNHGADACEKRFERFVGCLEGLAEVERGSAWALVGVALGVVVWLGAMSFVGASGEGEGTGRVLGEVDEDGDGEEEQGVGRRIGYRDDAASDDGAARGAGAQQNGANGGAAGSNTTKSGTGNGHVHISDLVDDAMRWDGASGR